MMRRFILAVLLLVPIVGLAQTTCSTTNPCVQVTITNPNPVPSQAVLWSCMGDSTSCSLTALSTVIKQQTSTTLCPAVQSPWHCNSFSQTKNPQAYNDPEPYGSLMNYAAQATGTGGVSGVSQITIFPVSQPPTQVPSVGQVPVLVTTGNAGPQ